MTGMVDVWFASGSRGFLEGFRAPTGTPVMMWVERCGRRRPEATAIRSWFGVSHEMVGGSTTARGVFGKELLDELEVPTDVIRRGISHIMKFSIRPEPCQVPCSEAHYSISDRLSVHRTGQLVVYATGFSRTGWGKRALADVELSQAFDLPSYVSWDPMFPKELIPIQVFRVLIDAVLATIRPTIQQRGGSRPCFSDARQSATMTPLPIDAEWIESLQQWLPGSWCNVIISDRAVKADNAAVEQFPWNQRIMLVFPSATAPSIRGMEKLGLKWWQSGLKCSFLSYLETTYGPDWRHHAGTVKRNLRGGQGGSRGSKRKRCYEHRERIHDEGGFERGYERLPAPRDCVLSNDRLQQLDLDVKCGFRILSQVLVSSWWEWTGGSALFFWRWNGEEQIRAARDGIPIFVSAALPKQRKQKPAKLSADQRAVVASKLDAMVKKDYLETGYVASTLHFFAVPKGDSDIRVVFDGTSSGLNESLWAPNFFLPTSKSALMCMSFSTWMADMDFGDMFHNFHMDPGIRPCSGVELGDLGPLMTSVDLSGRSKPAILRWTRLFMGMRPSPYNAVRHYFWGEEFARGNPARVANPMGYDRVRLNLPGMSCYDPASPKVMKWRDGLTESDNGNVAGDVVTFVDDVRITGHSKANCWNVYRQFASRIQFLGMQNAPRKFRPPSQSSAGAWTGTIFKIGSHLITKSVSQDKWEKGRQMVERLLTNLLGVSDSRPLLDRRGLEKETGFLNHLSMTYETMVPYLKGFYLTLNSWRGGRDDSDWKVSDKRWKSILFARVANGRMSDLELDVELNREEPVDAPLLVKASPSLRSDVEALSFMFEPRGVPEISVRSRSVVTIVYGFGDASGTGLGATFTCEGGFNFRIGVWGADEDPESSNWKEFTNIVESLEDEATAGNLAESEVYMFTDNSTVESCAAKGSSSSAKLLGLIIRLHGLMTRSGVKIHIFHVAGTRMIAQGTDGVSRGYLGQGVMAGEAMVAHVPIHISAISRAPENLVPWIRGWSGKETILLDEKGWFESGHDIEGWKQEADGFERPILSKGRRTYIWAPPPIAAEVAVAEMRKARIKRQNACHVFVCPRLCTTQWVKQLYRASDIVFEIPVGFSCWPVDMHEPLLIGILFPFISVKPWQIKGAPKMFAVGRELRKVLQESDVESGRVLRKLFALSRDLRTMPEHMVWKLLFLH